MSLKLPFKVEFKAGNWAQLRYLLFARKRCPDCGARLVRLGMFPTVNSTVQKEQSGSQLKVTFESKATDAIQYHCGGCHKSFWLSQLAPRA